MTKRTIHTKYKNTIFVLSSYVRHTRLVSYPSGIRDQRKRHKRSVRYAVYHGSFTWQKSDGSSEKITVPGRYPYHRKILW